MSKAYVKIWVEPGMEQAVREALLDNKEVKTADITSGEQDIVSLVESKDYETLMRLIVNHLRDIKGIVRSSTNLVIEM
ncbi:MAG: Lrp/AsnC ligand binding domain-containing protein [Planctomycetota bacterium]